ncbi:MAG: NAD-dependent epimerase/dehydratase family protein, partial [Chloroflexi bacterium]|nr:NAD-dependent epimerase/dehydratase family protein [Chloroflexota bacterium]
MKVLVTGGSGAIGRYVIKELKAHDIAPVILDMR